MIDLPMQSYTLKTISENNMIELFKSIAVNQVLTSVKITVPYCPYFKDCCEEKVLALLLENNFSLKEIWLYQLNVRYESGMVCH